MSMRDLETITVELSIGLTLVMSQSNWRISRKKARLELEAETNPLEEPDDQLFALNFYPLLASAVTSENCPTIEQCLNDIPEQDLEIWYQASKKINPEWFVYMDAISDLMRQRESSDTETKKEQSLSLNEDESPQS